MITVNNIPLKKKWKNCRDVQERHEFYEVDNDRGRAICINCDVQLFEQKHWVFADSGLDYGGLVR